MKSIAKIILLVAASTAATFANDADVLAQQAAEQLKAGDTKAAVGLYEQALQANPESAQLQTDYANALTRRIGEVNFMAQGMIAGKMLKAYQRSVEIDPEHVVGWIGLSRYYINAPAIAGGSADKAEEYAHQVMNLVPFLGHVEMGLVAEKRGETESAVKHFEKALELNPDHGEARYHLDRLTQPAEAGV